MGSSEMGSDPISCTRQGFFEISQHGRAAHDRDV
jgi:hypothetical protein